ncbi:MAG: hypothetical protein AAF604_14725 [Acidobacteriota bacterium]
MSPILKGKTALVLFAALLLLLAPPIIADDDDNDNGAPPSLSLRLPNSTQGPLWPPSEMTNEAGDFITVGITLSEANGFPGFPFFGQKLIISKDTVPPLDENGNRIINNWFAASHDIIRPLDLREGSPDRDIVLYNLSIGPADELGIPRIPAEGDSAYNLYTDGYPCQDIFPTPEQKANYSRPRTPLHEFPVWGFQGDQIGYDVVTGQPYDPNARLNFAENCFGCSGENTLDFRPNTEPITLGDWTDARGRLRITLTDWDEEAGGYTAAFFKFNMRNLVPNSVYTVWTIRPRRIPGLDFMPQADPLSIPNIFVTDDRGKARGTLKVIHPFPDPATDFGGERLDGLVVAWHPDYQNWGACGGLLGAGVDLHTVFNTFVEGNTSLAPFITVPPSGG